MHAVDRLSLSVAAAAVAAFGVFVRQLVCQCYLLLANVNTSAAAEAAVLALHFFRLAKSIAFERFEPWKDLATNEGNQWCTAPLACLSACLLRAPLVT